MKCYVLTVETVANVSHLDKLSMFKDITQIQYENAFPSRHKKISKAFTPFEIQN